MMLEPEQKSAGVIAASAGNHALALAYHGGQLSKYTLYNVIFAGNQGKHHQN